MATLNIKNFPDDLHARLRDLAAREHRSVAQQVVHLLERAVGPPRRSLKELRGLGRDLWRRDGSAESYLESERDDWD